MRWLGIIGVLQGTCGSQSTLANQRQVLEGHQGFCRLALNWYVKRDSWIPLDACKKECVEMLKFHPCMAFEAANSVVSHVGGSWILTIFLSWVRPPRQNL